MLPMALSSPKHADLDDIALGSIESNSRPLDTTPTSGSSSFHHSRRSATYSPSAARIRNHSSTGHLFHACHHFMPEYIYRIFNYQQMDWKSAGYQMVTLCMNPTKVFKAAYYRKQTKNQWARDDPAFVVVLVYFLMIATIASALVFQVSSFSAYLWLLFQSIVIEFVGFGLLISTATWWITNQYCRNMASNSIGQGMGDTFFVEQRVEWLFAFDIHCNSYFVFFLIVDVLQFFFLPLLLGPSFLSLVFANTLGSLAYGAYFYITFLGYTALPFLNHTEKFLSPLVLMAGLYLSSIAVKILFGATFNFSTWTAHYYYGAF